MLAVGEDLVEVVTVRVGDEDLSEGVTGDKIDDLLYASGIELVEDVVEQEQGSGGRGCPAEKVKLGQFQGEHECLCLSLTALAPHGVVADEHLQVVAVNAVERIAHGTVLEAVALDHFEQRTPLAVGHIAEGHLLVLSGNFLIHLLEDGYQLIDERVAPVVDALSLYGHLLLPDLQKLWVGLLFHLEEHIALLQGFVVAHQGIEVGMVEL